MDVNDEPHFTYVWRIHPREPHGSAVVASCTRCGRLDTPPRESRQAANVDARAHGTLVTKAEADLIIGRQLSDALGPNPTQPRGGL